MTELLAEAPRVRALARVLVGDADADDLAQESWLLALRHGGDGVERGPIWLTAIVRNAARSLHRGQRRRDRRERDAAARAQAVPSSADLLLREERRRALVAAVDALPSDLRAAVLLRFFEGLPPRQIARELGVPATTVWSRLRNALQRLRGELDREHGDRRAWLLPLVGPVPVPPIAPIAPPPSAPWIQGVTTMAAAKMKGALIGGAALVVLAALAWVAFANGSPGVPWPDGDHGPLATASTAAAGGLPAAGGQQSADGAATGEVAPRDVVAAEPAAAPAVTGSLRVRARFGGSGDPAIGITLLVRRSDADRLVQTQRVPTDGDGVVRCRELRPGDYLVGDDRASPPTRCTITAGEETVVVHEVRAGLHLRGIVVDPTGVPVAGASVEVSPLGDADGDCEVLAISGADGTFAIRSAPYYCLVGARAAGFASSTLRFLLGKAGTDAEVRLELRSGGGVVTGIVTDPAGEPVPGAVVRVGAGKTSGLMAGGDGHEPIPAQVRTDAEGRFRAVGVPAGSQPLVVRAHGLSPWRGVCTVVDSAAVAVRVELAPGAALRGRVLAADGGAVARARVTVGGDDAVEQVAATTAADGTYALSGLPAGPVEVVAQRNDGGRGRAAVTLLAGETRTLDLTLDAGRTLRGRVLDDLELPVAGAVITAMLDQDRSWQSFARSGDDGRFEVPKIPGDDRVTIYLQGTNIEMSRHAYLDPGVGEIVLHAQKAEPASAILRGRVESSSGQPVAGAHVVVARSGQRGGSVVTTAADGRFETGPQPPGELVVTVNADGQPELRTGTTVAADQTVDLGVLRLPVGGTVRVEVEGGADGVRWGAIDAAGGYTRLQRGDEERVPLAPGHYWLQVSGGDLAAQAVPFAIHPGEVTTVRVPRPAAALQHIDVASAQTTGARGVVLVLVERDGVRLGGFGADWVPGSPCSLDLRLAPGRYTLQATLGSLTGRVEVAIGDPAATPRPVRIELR